MEPKKKEKREEKCVVLLNLTNHHPNYRTVFRKAGRKENGHTVGCEIRITTEKTVLVGMNLVSFFWPWRHCKTKETVVSLL
jgi:hypothetical protein